MNRAHKRWRSICLLGAPQNNFCSNVAAELCFVVDEEIVSQMYDGALYNLRGLEYRLFDMLVVCKCPLLKGRAGFDGTTCLHEGHPL